MMELLTAEDEKLTVFLVYPYGLRVEERKVVSARGTVITGKDYILYSMDKNINWFTKKKPALKQAAKFAEERIDNLALEIAAYVKFKGECKLEPTDAD